MGGTSSSSQRRQAQIRWESFFLSFLILLFAAVSIGWFYLKAYEAVLASERKDLERLAQAAATVIDPQRHALLRSPEQTGSDLHHELLEPLVRFHQQFPSLEYVYTAIRQDHTIFFVLDTRSTDVFGTIGERDLLEDGSLFVVYENPSPTLHQAFSRQHVASEPELHDDEYGTFLSAYAPLRDQDGIFHGIVGVDINDRELKTRLAHVRRAGIAGFALALTFALVVAIGHTLFRHQQISSQLLLRERQEQLSKSEHLLKQTQQLGRITTWSIHLETLELRLDEFHLSLMGYPDSSQQRLITTLPAYSEGYVHPDDIPLLQQRLQYARENRTNDTYQDAFEYRFLRPDGSHGYFSVVAGRLRFREADGSMSASSNIVVGLAQDISERKSAEQALMHLNEELENRIASAVEAVREKERLLLYQSRLATMGEMVANIAHQWRQPLTAVSLHIQDLQMEAESAGSIDNATVQEAIIPSLEQIRFMSRTIDDFSNFFKPDKDKVFFSLREAVEETLFLLSPGLRSHNIEVYLEGQDDTILGYLNEFSQVIMNILNNARDALISRGVERPFIDIRLFHVDNRPVITIADNAGGIREHLVNHIFEPYFTTKSTSSGTGLGLYMSKVIIEESMGGKLGVRNTEVGAEFRIEL